MAVMSLSYSDRRTRFGGLILDLTLTESVEFENEVTQFPVEDGVTISDHITEGSERIRIGGTIATQDVASYEQDDEGRARVVDVVEQCRRLYKARELLEVSTGQLLYPDMALTRLTATRTADAEGGNWISIQAELTKVKKVNLKTAEVPAEQKVSTQGGAKGRAGETNKATGTNAGATANNRTGEQYGPQRGKGPLTALGQTETGQAAIGKSRDMLRGLGDVLRGGAAPVP